MESHIIEREFNNYWTELSNKEKETLLEMAKQFVFSRTGDKGLIYPESKEILITVEEGELLQETKTEWWENVAFTEELDVRYSNYQSGNEKAFSLKEIEDSLEDFKKQ